MTLPVRVKRPAEPAKARGSGPAPVDAASSAGKASLRAGSRTTELTELGKAFRRVFRSLSRLRGRDTHLGGSELSHAQFELLIELHERGELSAGELAAAARLAPATVTQMLHHLDACGHVERVRSQTDRRVVVSRLTPQGRRKIEAKRALWQSRWEQALDGVDVKELRAATRVLERLGAVFEDAPPVEARQTPRRGAGEPRRGSKQASEASR
jgi:MarR family transcriptional regulator, organic hydroperoxide resistance regulator